MQLDAVIDGGDHVEPLRLRGIQDDARVSTGTDEHDPHLEAA